MVLVDATSDDTRLVLFNKLIRLREDTTGKPIPPVRTSIFPGEKEMSAEEKSMAAQMGGGPPVSSKLPPALRPILQWIQRRPERTTDGSPFTCQEFAELYAARQAHPHLLGDTRLIVLIAGKREELPDTPEKMARAGRRDQSSGCGDGRPLDQQQDRIGYKQRTCHSTRRSGGGDRRDPRVVEAVQHEAKLKATTANKY
jgi:hypothetical protein